MPLSAEQADSNVTRQQLAPIWKLATKAARTALADYESGLVPGQALERERQKMIDTTSAMITGLAASMTVAEGYSLEEARRKVAEEVFQLVDVHVKRDPKHFEKQYDRATKKYHFVIPTRNVGEAAGLGCPT